MIWVALLMVCLPAGVLLWVGLDAIRIQEDNHKIRREILVLRQDIQKEQRRIWGLD